MHRMPHAEPTKKWPPMVRQHHEGPAHTGCRLGRNRYVPEVIVSTFPALYQAKFALNGPQFPGLIRRAQTAQAGRVGMTLTTVQPGQDTTITTRKARRHAAPGPGHPQPVDTYAACGK